jgi:hypothetical protein
MAGPEMVKGALTALEIPSHPIFLAQGVEILVTTGEQLVGVGLVTHIPDHLVAIEIEGLVKGKREFHDPQAWAKVAAAGGDNLQMALPHLASDSFEFGRAQTVQLVWMAQLAEMHARPLGWAAI